MEWTNGTGWGRYASEVGGIVVIGSSVCVTVPPIKSGTVWVEAPKLRCLGLQCPRYCLTKRVCFVRWLKKLNCVETVVIRVCESRPVPNCDETTTLQLWSVAGSCRDISWGAPSAVREMGVSTWIPRFGERSPMLTSLCFPTARFDGQENRIGRGKTPVSVELRLPSKSMFWLELL